MSVTYNNLWSLLQSKNIKKTVLKKELGLSSSTIAKMTKNEYVSLVVIEKICNLLECEIEDVVSLEKSLKN